MRTGDSTFKMLDMVMIIATFVMPLPYLLCLYIHAFVCEFVF